MAFILDVIIIAIVVLCVIRGAKKGFIRAAFSILTFFIAAMLSFMFYVPFSDYIINTPMGQNMSTGLENSIYQTISGGAVSESPTEPSVSPSPEESKLDFGTTDGIINTLKLPEFMFSSVMAQSDFLMRTARITAAEAVSKSLSEAFMNAVSGIALFILILILLWLLRFLLEFVFKIPLLREVNKLAGFAAGLVNGVLISYLILAIFSSLSGFPELSFIRETAQKSYIYNNLYQTNILFEMFTK